MANKRKTLSKKALQAKREALKEQLETVEEGLAREEANARLAKDAAYNDLKKELDAVKRALHKDRLVQRRKELSVAAYEKKLKAKKQELEEMYARMEANEQREDELTAEMDKRVQALIEDVKESRAQ